MNSINRTEKKKINLFIETLSKKIDDLYPEIKRNGIYKIGDIEWSLESENIDKKIIKNLKIIRIINSEIINPPSLNQDKYKIIKFNQNNLNILDALCYHGGLKTNYRNKIPLYSEHFGSINTKQNYITNIKIFTNIKFFNEDDPVILLPNTDNKMNSIKTIFHTHPVVDNMFGRIKEGIILDYPSANDIHHFSVHNLNGLDNSIIVSQEGLYCIRSIDKNIKRKLDFYETEELARLISINMKEYVNKYNIKEITFNKYYNKIINDMSMNKNINNYLNKKNIHIEYYPRVKKDDKYLLRPFYFKVK